MDTIKVNFVDFFLVSFNATGKFNTTWLAWKVYVYQTAMSLEEMKTEAG